MIIDHRTYTAVPGHVKRYLELVETVGLPIQFRHLGPLVGYFQTAVGPLNQIIHLWQYEDMADMERRRASRDADPDWTEYRKATTGLLVSQENKILSPLSFSPMK